MFWIIIWLVLAFLFARLPWKDGESIGVCMLAFIFASIILGFSSVILAVGPVGVSYETNDEQVSIYSLRDDTQISGNFILGTGGFGSSQEYYFFRDHSSGGVIRGDVIASRTPIIEDDSQEPMLIEEVSRVKEVSIFWAHPLIYFNRDEWIGTTRGFDGGVQGNTLVVPEGTIIKEFRIE